jgi:hypothetical protein
VIEQAVSLSADEVGEYCRSVEDHLTRANAGHIVRIVGPGFELVRQWALSGVPLSIVYRGIDDKAERHREGQARRPLRIEFCEGDVRALFENWRRAIGLSTKEPDEVTEGRPEGTERGTEVTDTKRPSLTKHLDRAIDKLSRVGGRMDLSPELRDACDRVLQSLVELRHAAVKVRGDARLAMVEHLAPLDRDLAAAVRDHAPAGFRGRAQSDAAADLAPYRDRLPTETWQRSLEITTDRMLRDRLGLPLIDL